MIKNRLDIRCQVGYKFNRYGKESGFPEIRYDRGVLFLLLLLPRDGGSLKPPCLPFPEQGNPRDPRKNMEAGLCHLKDEDG